MLRYYSNVLFPDDCKAVLDITKAPYFADNTGREDCTRVICRALDDVLGCIATQMEEVYRTLQNSPDGTYLSRENRRINGRILAIFPTIINLIPMLYFPNGVYLVSDTLTYSLKALHNMMYHYESGGFELNQCIRFIGQSREHTVIKLADHAKGFEYGQRRPVVDFMHGESSNVALSNYFENMTIDTGAGNPGAVGIVFFANNSGCIRNVTIKTSGSDNEGFAGIWVRSELHSAVNAAQMKIVGFETGIRIDTFRTCSYFENIELLNQQKYGISINNTSAQLLNIQSKGNVPVLNVRGPLAHVILSNGDFASDGTEHAAIKYTMGCLLVRNIHTHGFAAALEKNWFEAALPDGEIEEYCTHPGYSFCREHPKTLNLTVPELPDPERENDFSQWACVNDYGAVGDGVTDDTQSIQRAMRSGKKVIWFQPGHYMITRPIDIPETVENVQFMYSDVRCSEELGSSEREGVFTITGNSSALLLIEKLFSWNQCTGKIRMFRHAGKRNVFFRDMHTQGCAFYFNTVRNVTAFFENCACTIGDKKLYFGVPAFWFDHMTAWCHSINPERSYAGITNIGGQVWWSGFKTEQEGSIAETYEGGVTEILGGVAVAGTGSERPVILNDHSTVSAVFSTTGYHQYSSYPVAVKEIMNEETRYIRDAQLPQRYFPWYFMPLYFGTDHGEARPKH